MARKNQAQIAQQQNEAAAETNEAAAAQAAAQFVGPWPFPTNPIVAENEAIEPESSEEISDEELAAQQAAADAAYEADIEKRLTEMGDAPRASKKVYVARSSVIRPTKRVWAIADAMVARAEAANLPMPTRAEIISECIAKGIASGTSATQYQHWKKANGL